MNKQLDIAVKALKTIDTLIGTWECDVARNALRDIEAITSSNETSATPDVGVGYRLLAVGEILQEGDECLQEGDTVAPGTWRETEYRGTAVGEKGTGKTYRRKLAPEPIVEPRIGTWNLDGGWICGWICGCVTFPLNSVSDKECSGCGALRPPLPVEAAEPVKVGVWLRGGIWVCACLSKFQHLATVERCPNCHWVRPGPNGESPTQTEQVPSSEQVELGGGDSQKPVVAVDPIDSLRAEVLKTTDALLVRVTTLENTLSELSEMIYIHPQGSPSLPVSSILDAARDLIKDAKAAAHVAGLAESIAQAKRGEVTEFDPRSLRGSTPEQAITPEPEATRSVPLPEQELEQASSVSQNEDVQELLAEWTHYLPAGVAFSPKEIKAFQAGWKAKTKASKSKTSANSASAVKTEGGR